MGRNVGFSVFAWAFCILGLAQAEASMLKCLKDAGSRIGVIDVGEQDMAEFPFSSRTGQQLGRDLLKGMNVPGVKLNSHGGSQADAIYELRRQQKDLHLFVSTHITKSSHVPDGVALTVTVQLMSQRGALLHGDSAKTEYIRLPQKCRSEFAAYFDAGQKTPPPECLASHLATGRSSFGGLVGGPEPKPADTRNPAISLGRIIRAQILSMCGAPKYKNPNPPKSVWSDGRK